jgi:hypothetical protein
VVTEWSPRGRPGSALRSSILFFSMDDDVRLAGRAKSPRFVEKLRCAVRVARLLSMRLLWAAQRRPIGRQDAYGLISPSYESARGPAGQADASVDT